MSEENIKKVNNESSEPIASPQNGEAPSPESVDIFDDIMGGMYDLAKVYSSPVTARADAEKEKARQKREKEMAAIKEDIERRYSRQVEESRSGFDAFGDKMPTEGKEAQGEEGKVRLDEMLDLEAIRNTPSDGEKEKKPKKEKKAKKEKEPVYIELDEKNAIYAGIYSLGDTVVRFLEKILGIIIHALALPIIKIRRISRSASSGTKRKFRARIKATRNEMKYFRREIHSANRSLLRSLKHPFSIPSILLHYIGKAFTRHKHLLTTFFNTALPVAALILLIAVFNYWNKVTFALDVIYNGESIGYISDESVFIEARDLVMDRLSANATTAEMTSAASQSLDAGYELALVSLDELNDARTISDKMIENSVDNLIHACGIYIDGNFICAVKNEADAKTVFHNILEPYEQAAEEGGYVVGFAQSIDYVQGLYRDDPAIMWDASTLENTVIGAEGARANYTIAKGDTIYTVAEKYGTTAVYLSETNSNISEDNFPVGTTISVPSSGKMITIKKTVSSSKIRSVPFETVTTRDATKYSGYRVVRQEGVDGTEREITTKTYVDGELINTEKRYETIAAPIEQILIIGTRTTFGGVYIGEASEMGFLWPAPSCHYVSSPYGWRSSGWHKGIDLCTGNGTALGSPVIASRSGVVELVQRSDSGYGNMVLISHGDGYKTRYAHMITGSITVNIGDTVEAGQTIGKVGSTGNSSGPHLHFEVIYNGETQDPKNYIS